MDPKTLVIVFLSLAIISQFVLLYYYKNKSEKKLETCKKDVETCKKDVETCKKDLQTCEEANNFFDNEAEKPDKIYLRGVGANMINTDKYSYLKNLGYTSEVTDADGNKTYYGYRHRTGPWNNTTKQENKEYVIGQKGIDTTKIGCAQQCLKDANCGSFQYNINGVGDNRCYLFNSEPTDETSTQLNDFFYYSKNPVLLDTCVQKS